MGTEQNNDTWQVRVGHKAPQRHPGQRTVSRQRQNRDRNRLFQWTIETEINE